MDDRYQIIQRTAELPYGVRYEATDTLINRKAEIHRFKKPGEDAPKDWEKTFNKYSGALTTLSHMGLQIIYDRGVDEEGPYLIRQLVDEPNLTSRLKEGPLSEYEFWELAQQLLDIHTAGLPKDFFHGALDLDQICYATRPGGEKRYYISNFGLPELHNQINGSQEYFGSPCLVSLEQADGEGPSESAEIFSIGQLLYMSLSDNHPFAANRVDEMAELHKNYPLAPIHLSRQDIPKAMSDWLYRMTTIDAKDRFATYADALHHLPAPQQTAPVPVIPTTTTQQQVNTPLGQTTTVQQTVNPLTAAQAVNPQTGTQAVGFTTTTQAVTASAGASSAKQGNALKQLLQEPLIIGGAVLVIILIVVGAMVFSGDDDPATADAKEKVEENNVSGDSLDDGKVDDKDDQRSTLAKGLIAALNFDDSLLAKNDRKIKVEALKSAPKFEKGLYQKGLVLDKEHYYRLPMADVLSDDTSSGFSISFWVKNLNQQEPAFISDKPWSDGESTKVAGKDDKEMWQWTPENAAAREKARRNWSMVTMVFSQKNKKVTVYTNGEMVGASSTDAIKSLDEEKYLYIGCDSRQQFNFAAPTVIDQLYIWNRKLSSREIRTMFKEDFTY
ncbi:hypothetical protein HW115_07090 [Verrucomicrobiaceae bacterium N1E253]|uniref:Protein kinase domain-containing protein n=1 Tax=Oceaniferula marina TaxID=2748318 RepID=A0A851GKX3_9BACT|nr:LamG-like jellyroll fold domain-containing protein [Oceaniferula marina]NWK55370.1 hypothetical protein [Oceaniferula marina]